MSSNHHCLEQSQQWFTRAQQVIPGGVNSPVRAYGAVEGQPPFIARAYGPYIEDIDGNQYIDYVCSWGADILGHADAKIIAQTHEQLLKGFSYGAPCELEVLLAEKIRAFMPNLEMLRMVNSGTEATMTAIRIARGYTGRDKIIKFAGCYHGHSDSLLVNAGSGALTFGVPSSAGVPEVVAQDTLVATFNDIASVAELFRANPEKIAAIIVEPVCGNMNCVLPEKNFLAELRQLCDNHQALLIFDEVMTGFRVAKGGAQEIYEVNPDLTTLAKVIGAGFPIGCVGGRRQVMEILAPLGPVYQAGTLSGNPIAMIAGLTALTEIEKISDFYETLQARSQRLVAGIKECAQAENIALSTNAIGGMFGLFFTDLAQVSSLEQVKACDQERFKKFFHALLAAGINWAPSAFETAFISYAHDEKIIDETINKFALAFHASK